MSRKMCFPFLCQKLRCNFPFANKLSVDSPFGFMVCKKSLIYQDDQPLLPAIPERESV